MLTLLSLDQQEQYTWDDVEPLPLNIEDSSVASILYTDKFKTVMGLFRALQQKEEYSECALALTGSVIELIAAHYTVWQYRHQIIIRLNKDINKELEWVDEITLDNPKNYQIWGYRQSLLKHLNMRDIHRDIPIIDVMIEDDPKNYHVWSYRKWCVQWCDDWSNELPFVDKCLEKDVYNNSAWCHRYFTVCHSEKLSEQVFDYEVEYTMGKISLAPHNESSWNYLVGLFEKADKSLIPLEIFAQRFIKMEGPSDAHEISLWAFEVLTRIYKEKGETAQVIENYELLRDKYDVMRANYWDYQRKLLLSN